VETSFFVGSVEEIAMNCRLETCNRALIFNTTCRERTQAGNTPKYAVNKQALDVIV
jgi:hypothetical protein